MSTAPLPSQKPATLLLSLAQATIMAAAVWLFLQPLATGPGLIVALTGTYVAYVAAYVAQRVQLRLSAGLVIATAFVFVGQLGARIVLAQQSESTTSTIEFGDSMYLGLMCMGLLFAVRLLRERIRAFSIVEVALVVGSVAHTFADHRHQRIHQPRFLSDWAWTNGIDPQTVLSAVGISAIVVSLLMLLRGQRLAKLLLSLLLLLLLALGAYFLLGDHHIDVKADTNGLGLTGNDSKDNSSSSSSSSRKPDPVAIAIFHDDLEVESDVLYFRQTVRSRLAGERLVEDNTGKWDKDVLVKYPAGAPVESDSEQNPAFHIRVPTSMFLMVQHPQPVGLGHPAAYLPLDNPDPRRFVAAYRVDSLLANGEPTRLLGRNPIPASWSEEEKQHYLELPDDPRYGQLAQQIVRELDPRYVNDPVVIAWSIKRYLESEGFYSLQQKELVGVDPVAKFLFGEMKGYCVHFAHSAVFLFRSQGIPARVALGYAVSTSQRGSGSAMLITGNMAHAWPEIYVDGVGWVTFDVYPERSDEPRPPPTDAELEQMLGEIARKDKSAGRSADPDGGWYIPWGLIGGGFVSMIGAMLLFAYVMKIGRRLRGGTARLVYRGVLDRLGDLGYRRLDGESRERHAQRVAKLAPSFINLTDAHLRWALGPPRTDAALGQHKELARAAQSELSKNVPLGKRIIAFFHPIGWLFTR